MSQLTRISDWTYEVICRDREAKNLPPVSIEEADSLVNSAQHAHNRSGDIDGA